MLKRYEITIRLNKNGRANRPMIVMAKNDNQAVRLAEKLLKAQGTDGYVLVVKRQVNEVR